MINLYINNKYVHFCWSQNDEIYLMMSESLYIYSYVQNGHDLQIILKSIPRVFKKLNLYIIILQSGCKRTF